MDIDAEGEWLGLKAEAEAECGGCVRVQKMKQDVEAESSDEEAEAIIFACSYGAQILQSVLIKLICSRKSLDTVP